MAYEHGYEGAVREYLAGAERALTRGDAVSASKEIVEALKHCFSGVRQLSTSNPDRYRQAWEDVAKELSKLPPSLVRHAARIIDDLG